MLLADRVAVVSGIGPGLGRAIALACAREGADVVLAARSADTLEDVAQEVRALGRTATTVPTDVTDPEAVAALAEATMAAHGRVDVLCNNAFVQPPLEAITDATPDTWRQAFEVNLFGTVAVTNVFAPHLAADGGGAVVFTASMSARRVRRNFAVYSATKSALLTTMQHYANELGRDGVRCNAIVPGYIWGPNLEAWFAWQASKREVDPQVVHDEVASETALHHLPTSEEVADAAVFLASDLSRAITGVGLDVNAGNWFH
jgi:NAD(P)-dependent dehydrogenase (short-subunit alcohol dehydrogenase family)